jgi:hypothetical protein
VGSVKDGEEDDEDDEREDDELIFECCSVAKRGREILGRPSPQ